MARIQSRSCGRKPPKLAILSKEINRKGEETLTRLGAPSRKWGDFSRTRKPQQEPS